MKGQNLSPMDSTLVLSAALHLPGNGNGEGKEAKALEMGTGKMSYP